MISAYNVACGYALAGDKSAALDWLEISVEGGYTDFEHMRDDPDLDSLRKERRYHRLLIDLRTRWVTPHEVLFIKPK